MPEPIPTIHLDLSPAAVAPLAHAAAILSQEVVNLYFDALAKADLSKILPAVGRKIVRHNISDLKIDRVERRRRHENWTLAKAFQDLLRGVRESLEQAYLVTEIAWKHHRVKSDSTLYEFITPFKDRAAKLMHLSFPYVRIFYERFGKEVEIEAGVPVDAEDGKDEVQLLMKIDLRMRSFTLNDRLEIAAADFDEIVFAACYFGTELAAKLPMSPSN